MRLLRTALAASFVVVLSVLTNATGPVPVWMRYAAISPDGKTLVFEYKGDLWRVPSTGGTAVALTQNDAYDYLPAWSHDGKTIAFASDRHGNFDVFVMPADGGEPTRLTYHSVSESPYTFTPDDRFVVFGAARQDTAANRQYPSASQPELYKVPVTGGRVEQVLTTPAEDVRFSQDGRTMLYMDKKGGENPWRKHHVSSIARDIWAYDVATGAHRKVTTFAGEDRSPSFVDNGRSFVYLSEESGTFNVHKMSVQGGASQKLTSFKGIPVRFLTVADNGTMAFSQDGQLYTLGAGGGAPKRLDITLAADTREVPKVVPVTGGARELAVSPNGKEVAFIARGDVFVTSVEGSTTKQITKTPEIENSVSFSPDGKALIYASERGGRWSILEARHRDDEPYFYASTVIAESAMVSNTHENDQPSYSPDGKELAYIEDRNTLKILTLATRQVRTLLTSRELFASDQNRQYFQWSPDGKWMLFDYAVPGVAPGEVGVIKADGTGKAINLTVSGFNDRGAKWILGGKGMLWLSNRDGLKAVAQAGGAQVDVYGMFFTVDAWDRYRLTKDEFALVKDAEEKKEKEAAAKKVLAAAPDETPLELDGVDARKARLTIHSSLLGDAAVSKDGETLYYLARFERGMNLWTTNLRTKDTRQLVALNASSGTLEWDKEQKTLFLLSDGTLSKIDPASGKRDPITINGEMRADPAAERAAAFEHVWRRTKNTFYNGTYHGIDWAAIKPAYLKYLPGIGNNADFAEMLAEMLGELNISHSGATYTGAGATADATASLGLFHDQTYTGAGVKVVEVLRDGPLARAGMSVTAGTLIEAIDGEAITARTDLSQFLNRKAGRKVLLTVSDAGAKRDLVVTPITIADENRLLYARWVKRNQDDVERLSGGALGYVHLPGMNDGAFRTTVEDVLGRYVNKKGIVVDTRFNGGGDLVADLAMFLSGKQFFDYTTGTRSSGFEPNFRWTKPSIAIGGEANYSDGHCFVYAYKALGIGTLVGMPTPGTCTFAGWETLAEQNTRWGVPGVGVRNATGQFLENMQTTPDVVVMNEYGMVIKNRDQQLETAIAELTKSIAQVPTKK